MEPHVNRPMLGDWKDPDGLRRVQEAQLPLTLEAAARSPFYRKLGLIERLDQMPLTTKRDLREAYPFGMLAVDRSELATYHESSGSTGAPTASYYTAADWVDLVDRYARKHVGIEPSDTFLVRTPYALMITGHLAHAAARARGATVVPADNRSLATPYSTVVRLLHDLDVTLTWSLAADTLLWAAAAELAGLRPARDFPALRAIFVGGDPLAPARRARIAETWGVPVVEEYGATETGSLAGQCPHGRLHLWADRAIFEVLDPASGALTPTGRGQLVVTPLHREAMPLLRYNTEDEVSVSASPCECGWHLPTVQILGRTAFTAGAGGAELTQVGVEELVFGLPAAYGVRFWRARPSGERLEMQIEVSPEHAAAAARALGEAVGVAYGIEAVIETQPPGSLVPHRLLTAAPELMKPRGLFVEGEDWDRALRYY
jgi:phenylacetate-CoA ligase